MVNYLDRQENFKEDRLPRYQGYVDTGRGPDGEPMSEQEIALYQRIIDDIDFIDAEAERSRVTPADTTFTDKMTLDPG